MMEILVYQTRDGRHAARVTISRMSKIKPCEVPPQTVIWLGPVDTAPELWERLAEASRTVEERSLWASREEEDTYIGGVLYVADRPNLNGIVYTKDVMQKAVAEFNQRNLQNPDQQFVTLGNGCGQPVKLAKAAGVVTDLNCDENGRVIMHVKLLDTPMGKIVKDEVSRVAGTDGPYRGSAKVPAWGFGAVGMGSVKDGVVQDDFVLTSVDIVPITQLQMNADEKEQQPEKRPPRCVDCGATEWCGCV
jgi:hypothetical protein